jgi:lipid-A-disaccharide synthase
VIHGDVYRVLKACDLALVASGTATLEAAILETPMVVVYRVSFLSYWIGRMVISVPFIGLVNLVAGEEVVPELIQGDASPQRIFQEAAALLNDAKRMTAMEQELARVGELLGSRGASERVAGIAYDMINKKAEARARG